jgi:hypothetical protein
MKFPIWVALKLKQCAVSMGIGPYAREEQYCQHAYQSQDRFADMLTRPIPARQDSLRKTVNSGTAGWFSAA